MDNITVSVDANQIATIQIDLKNRGGRSASGKTIRVASTEGNKPIKGTDVVLGLNAYVKA